MREREDGFAVFNMNDNDYVAARDREEAIEFYMVTEEVSRSLIHVNPPELALDESFPYIDTAESEPRPVTHRQLIREALADRIDLPCILVSFIIPNNGNGKNLN